MLQNFLNKKPLSSNNNFKKFQKRLAFYKFLYYNLIEVVKSAIKWSKNKEVNLFVNW